MRFIPVFALLALSIPGAAFAQNTETNFATGPQYLMTTGSPLFSRSLATPTLSIPNPPPQTGATDATANLAAGANSLPVSQPASALNLYSVYYGSAPTISNEMNTSESPEESSLSELPDHIFNAGVWGQNTVHASREPGKGASQTERSTRVYTNADIDRLRQSETQKQEKQN